MMKPVVLQKLVMRDWKTGHVLNEYDLNDYEATWGNVYNMFHCQDMHNRLLHAATAEEGKGIPCKVVIDHVQDYPLVTMSRPLIPVLLLAARASITRLAPSHSKMVK